MRVALRYLPTTRRPAPTDVAGGAWYGTWDERRLYLKVAGDAAAPDPRLEATLWQIVDRFDAITRAIERFAAALAPDERVPLRARAGEWFPAQACGLARGGFGYAGVEVSRPEQPGRASVVFSTGEPDEHVTFEAVLDEGRPVEIAAIV
jgi:hypothetical protein